MDENRERQDSLNVADECFSDEWEEDNDEWNQNKNDVDLEHRSDDSLTPDK